MTTPAPRGRALRASPAVYFTSYGLSLLGPGMASVVLPLLVLDRTGDILAAGVLATVSTAASATTGVVAGLLVDRLDRRAVSVVSGLLGAVSVAALPLVDALRGLDMTWFLVLAVVGAVVRVPGMTAQEVLLPALARLGPAGPGRLDRLVATRETVGNPGPGRARPRRTAGRGPRPDPDPAAGHGRDEPARRADHAPARSPHRARARARA